MNSKLPIIAILLLLLSGTIFGGYYYNALQSEEGPCAGLVSEDEEPLAKPEQEVAAKIEKPEIQPEPEPEPIKPVVKETKPELSAAEKLSTTEQQIKNLLNNNGDKLSAEQKMTAEELLKHIDTFQAPRSNFKHTISGKIVDSFGEGVKGAQIMLQIDSKDSLQGYKESEGIKDKKRRRRMPLGYVRSYAVTDTQGQFTFVFSTNVKEGIDVLNVTMYSQHASHLKSDSQSLTIRNEETTDNLSFALKQAGIISGRVVDSYGAPIKGVRITANEISKDRKRNRSRSTSRQATSDAAGNFKLVGLKDGQYQVYGWAKGYQVESGKQHKVTVVTGQETYLAGDLILNKQSTLSFTLTSAEGAVSGRYVVLRFYNADGHRTSSRSARIGEGGKVIAANIPSGSVQFDVYVNGYEATEKQYVSITGGEETELGTITLMKAESKSSAETEKMDRMRELKKKMKAVKSR